MGFSISKRIWGTFIRRGRWHTQRGPSATLSPRWENHGKRDRNDGKPTVNRCAIPYLPLALIYQSPSHGRGERIAGPKTVGPTCPRKTLGGHINLVSMMLQPLKAEYRRPTANATSAFVVNLNSDSEAARTRKTNRLGARTGSLWASCNGTGYNARCSWIILRMLSRPPTPPHVLSTAMM